MTFSLAVNWWSVLIRGVLALLIGIAALTLPGITIAVFVFLFAAYALVDGVLSLAGAVRAVQAHERWGALLLEGVTGVIAGILTAFWPAITALTLIYLIAAWAFVTGIFEIVAAVRLRKHIAGEWLLGLTGVASVIFAVLVAAVPVAGALVVAFWFGVYELIFGGVLVALAFRLRKWHTALPPAGGVPAAAH